MARIAAISLLLLGSFASVSCQRIDQGSLRQEQQQILNEFQPVSYRRTGSLGREEVQITITRDGKLEATTQSTGKTTGQISDFQMMQLARLFEDWTNLQEKYLSLPRKSDTPITEIQFGDKKVVASDDAANIPDQFRRVRERLELLAREIKATR